MLSRGGCFGEPTADPNILFAWLVRNLERLVEELEYPEVRTGRVAAWVGYRDGRDGEGRSSLEAPSARFDTLLDALRPCLGRAWFPRASAGRMHLFAEKLTPRGAGQMGLFDGPGDRAERAGEVKREINARHGRFALRSAATLPLAGVYADPANGFDICDFRGKACF